MSEIEGSLELFWDNGDLVGDARRYRLVFVPLDTQATVLTMYIVGEARLQCYLADLQSRDWEEREQAREQARQWILELHSSTTLSIPNMTLAKVQNGNDLVFLDV